MSFLSPDFAPAWSRMTPDRVEPDIATALAEAGRRIDELAGMAHEGLSYENVVAALEDATETLDRGWRRVTHLDTVCNSPALRAAHNAMLPKVTDFYTRISLNDGLWRVLKAYAGSAEARGLTGVRHRHLEETLENFREYGADLPPEGKTELERLNAELSSATQKYSENVLDATNAWELVVTDVARLAGLPDSARDAARQGFLKKNPDVGEAPGWRFTLHSPSYLPLMKHARDEALRRQAWEAGVAVGRRAPHDNRALILKILSLRQAKAVLLGRTHFPDLVLRRRMARSGAAALAFTEQLHERTAAAFAAEQRELEAFKAMRTGEPAGPLEPWAMAFWAEERRREHFDFDEEQLRPYFPIDGVLGGLFSLVEKLFGVHLTERATVFITPESGRIAPAGAIEVWHPEVKFYDLIDHDGRHLGSFYADWHPRESKRGGAWMADFETGGKRPGARFAPHLGFIAGNLTAPVAGRPALLNHDEVSTIFHEFGHLIHHLFGEVEVKSLNGVHVPWDFVELPSQILENWTWERAGLDFFAKHFETGAPLPAELFEKMLASRNYMAASGMMRQLALGKLDLELHLHAAELAAAQPAPDLDLWLKPLLAPYLPRLRTEAPTIAARFTHLFSESVGYAAGYYSYKWAEVLDADAFTRFQREGVLNPETGRAFRETILARGNSAPPDELFRSFLGRDPDPAALLARSGLAG